MGNVPATGMNLANGQSAHHFTVGWSDGRPIWVGLVAPFTQRRSAYILEPGMRPLDAGPDVPTHRGRRGETPGARRHGARGRLSSAVGTSWPGSDRPTGSPAQSREPPDSAILHPAPRRRSAQRWPAADTLSQRGLPHGRRAALLFSLPSVLTRKFVQFVEMVERGRPRALLEFSDPSVASWRVGRGGGLRRRRWGCGRSHTAAAFSA
jgi:hypothetical protein